MFLGHQYISHGTLICPLSVSNGFIYCNLSDELGKALQCSICKYNFLKILCFLVSQVTPDRWRVPLFNLQNQIPEASFL